jgi:phosphate transport system substrate-binding protein
MVGEAIRVCLLLALVATMAVGGLAGCRPKTRATLVIRGSDTMVNLTAAWAESFMAANQGVQVSVQGGGSSTGFAALVDGSTDLANASRPIKDSETKALEAKGKPPMEFIVAYDAVTMIVNPANPLKSLTLAQFSDILTGKVTNWKDVGGPDQGITVYSRESSSGTYAFVQEQVMGKADFVSSARLMPSTESILQAVAQDKTGLGYVGLGYVTSGVSVLGVAREAGATPVVPTVASVLDKSYPISRALYIYSAGAPSVLGNSFIEFCVSQTGGQITQEMGFVPIK